MKKKTIRDFFFGLLLVNSVVTAIMFLLGVSGVNFLIGVSGVNNELNGLLNGVDTTTDNKLQHIIAQLKQSILSKEYIAFMLCIQFVYVLGFVNFYESIQNARTQENSRIP